MKKIFTFILILFLSFSLFSCKDEKTTNPVHDLYLEAVDNGYKGSYDEWLEEIKGAPGKDGREIELEVKDNYIVWRYKGDDTWTNLKALDELIGKDGKSVYEIYCKAHPEYTKGEDEWLDDLLNGRLVNNKYNLESTELELNRIMTAGPTKDKIKTYFYADGSVPYVGISEFISALDGYFKNVVMTRKIDAEKNIASYSYTIDDNTYQMDVDWKNDVISVNHTDFFTYLTGKDDAKKNLYLEQTGVEFKGESKASFDLKENNIDIIYHDDDLLIQLDVLSHMLLCYSLAGMVYNGEALYFFQGYPGLNHVETFRPSAKHGNSMPADLLKATNNGLTFIFDNYYGLDKLFGSFEDEMNITPSLLHNYNNPNPKYHDEVYKNILMTTCDDLHTSLVSKSVYDEGKDSYYKNDPSYEKSFGEDSKEFLSHHEKLKDSYSKVIDKPNDDEIPLKLEGNTAFIRATGFSYDSMSIYDKGKISADAWKYDTFFLIKQSLDKIRVYNEAATEKITNVVLDLSLNTGGVVDTMLGCIGLLTNKDIVVPWTNKNSGTDYVETYRVDANLDGDFTDDDAYTEFKYTLLISPISFSAGNSMPAIVKDLDCATLIGNRTGGGMCTVGWTALLDGTTFKFSSQNMLKSSKLDKHGHFTEIESGIAPHFEVPESKYYDYSYLNDFINNGYKANDLV